MRITLLCVGGLARAPEGRLARGYADRASATGRRLGLGPVEIREIDPRHGGKASEGVAIQAALGGSHLIACDRNGEMLTSQRLAELLARIRDSGTRLLAFAIGGADGLDGRVLSAASHRLSFGPQTWPHGLARVMLAEQIYRAASILAGAPYHRE